ncbi:MAG: thioredoxin family protein [Bacteroidota bacterium]
MKFKSLFIVLFMVAFAGAQAQENATTIMDKAYAQAKKEKKNVFVIFHASWCGWCKKMEKNMESDACKKMFDDNYVIVHLTVEESPKNVALNTPGADELKAKYKGAQQGLPFWVILDKKGTLLDDSFNDKDENLGCPAEPAEVTAFTAKLKKTGKFTDAQLATVTATFTIKK